MERSQPYVYILSDQGVPFYVGMGVGDRAYHHVRDSNMSKERETFKARKIRKILREGRDIDYEFIFCETHNEAADIERQLIIQYGRRGIDPYGILTNRAAGGRGGLTMTPEQIEQSAEARRGYWERLSPQKQNEIVDKIRQSKLLSGTWAQATEWMKSDANKNRLRQLNHSRKRMIEQYDDKTLIATYESAKKAAEATKLSQGSISNAANGKQKKAGGFVWKYVSTQ
jgi:hypothetical protein